MGKVFSIWAPPIIYVPIIVTLSIRPMPQSFPGNMDKVIHIVVYCLVGILFTRTLVNGMHINMKNRAIALALISSIALGTLIEAVQHFIPYREASFMDMTANAIGAFIGVSIYIFIAKPFKGQASSRL